MQAWNEGQNETATGRNRPNGQTCLWCDQPAAGDCEFCIEHRSAQQAKGYGDEEKLAYRAEADLIMGAARAAGDFLHIDGEPCRVRINGGTAVAIIGCREGWLTKGDDGGAYWEVPSADYAEAAADTITTYGVGARVAA